MTSSSLAFALLSFAVVPLSLVIHAVSGEWPVEFGVWGVAVFALLGVALLAVHATADGTADAPATSPESGD